MTKSRKKPEKRDPHDLIPLSQSRKLDASEHALMCQLNAAVCLLFETSNPSIKICEVLNGPTAALKNVLTDFAFPVNYVFGQMELVHAATIWLNVRLGLRYAESRSEPDMLKFIWLTPKQTYFVFEQVRENNPLVEKKLKVFVQQQIKFLRGSINNLEKIIKKGNPFEDDAKTNPIFDTGTGGAYGLAYTNWHIRALHYFEEAARRNPRLAIGS